MTRIALMTSNNRRHRWVAARLAEVAELACVIIEAKPPQNSGSSLAAAEIRDYFAARDLAEIRWFGDAPKCYEAVSAVVRELPWQGANSQEVFDLLCTARVDQVFLFGSCIIRNPILSFFQGRIVNMHLGLSPYYRGSATNYWPLVDGLPECVGVTVHHATAIVDGGGVLAQARPEVWASDSIHDLGCKTIMAGTALLQHFASQSLPLSQGVPQTGEGKLCRRADFNIESLRQVQSRMANGMLKDYLADKAKRDAQYPIVEAAHLS